MFNENKFSVAVIILTFNEEANIKNCLRSVGDWVNNIFIVDSYSTDKTLEIARKYTDKIYQNPFKHWATQRNWALDNLPINSDWVLFIDADECITPQLKKEIEETLKDVSTEINGFYMNRIFVFLGRRLKHGGYNFNRVLRLVRKDKAKILPAGDSEYFKIEGKTLKLKSFMIHNDRKDLSFFINKHNRISNLAVGKLVSKEKISKSDHSGKNVLEGKYRMWLKENLINRLPLFVRPFLLFSYRYFLRLGFLDGKEGFIYYFLHDFWYPFLIDAKYLEMKKNRRN